MSSAVLASYKETEIISSLNETTLEKNAFIVSLNLFSSSIAL